MSEQLFSNELFALGKKWFWVALATSLFSLAAGLILGISLLTEKNRRKEGIIIIVFALVCYLAKTLWLYPWLMASGAVPYRIIKA
ncbi:MAG TPA: hypothetical protein P5089_01645 [Candidatus Portnoybacteria bacterium]|nr:hypothetical protein [Candidatus Portnoybacteria bacterium]